MKTRIKKLWSLLNELYADYRARFVAIAALGLFGGFLEGVGISLLVPLFTVFVKGGGFDFGSNFALKTVSSSLSTFGLTLSFQTLLIITLVAFLLKTAILFALGYMRACITATYKTETRRRLYEAFLGTNFSYLRRQKTGHLNHIIMYDVKQATRLFDDVVGFVLSAGSSVMFLTVSFMLSWQITLLTALLGAVLVSALFPLLRKIRRYARELLSLAKRISHALAETLAGIKTVKALGVEDAVAESARALFHRVEQVEFSKHCIKIVTKLSFEPVSVIFILAVFAVSYRYLQFDLMSFVAIMYLINRVFGNINNMQASFSTALEILPAAQEFLAAFGEVKSHAAPERGSHPFSFTKEIAAENVSFNYERSPTALSEVSFRIKRGEVIGIIGPSGAGKTTLVDLLLGLIAPSVGRITVDGADARGINWSEWRRKIIYVSQEPFLRNNTISENIRFYDQFISNEDVLNACRAANIYDFVSALPKGLATQVGERGARLSGGERQRIALARAFARKPAVLILDEATSALDAESERSIQEALSRARGSVTVIIIAHRLATVLGADRIIALDGGRIVEEGSPEELKRNPDSYLSKMLAISNAQK